MKKGGRWNMGRAIIGILLIFIGLVYLGVSLGLFDWSVWLQIWRLWPMLIIGIGISFLFQNKLSRIISVVIFVVLLLFGFWFLWQRSEFQQTGAVDYRRVYETLQDGAERGKVSISLPSASVRLSGPSDTNTFVTGQVETRGSEHTWQSQFSGKIQEVIVSHAGKDFPFVGTDGFVELQMTQNLPLDIQMEVGKLDTTLDLTSLQVESVDISSGASTIYIYYGDKSAEVTTNIETGASAITFTAPQHVGVRLTTDSALTAASLESFETESDGVYITPGFSDAEKKITINISSGVASVEFTRV